MERDCDLNVPSTPTPLRVRHLVRAVPLLPSPLQAQPPLAHVLQCAVMVNVEVVRVAMMETRYLETVARRRVLSMLGIHVAEEVLHRKIRVLAVRLVTSAQEGCRLLARQEHGLPSMLLLPVAALRLSAVTVFTV